jgi:hypothetical protein
MTAFAGLRSCLERPVLADFSPSSLGKSVPREQRLGLVERRFAIRGARKRLIAVSSAHRAFG